jgi:hypothetical protein
MLSRNEQDAVRLIIQQGSNGVVQIIAYEHGSQFMFE